MRRTLVASLVGLVVLTVAAPATAAPTESPPVRFPGRFATESALQAQGFVTPKVFYRIGGTQDIVIVYDGGGPADPLAAIGQIEGTVWRLEQLRFDRLLIQNGNQAPFVVSYAELEASIGPRPPGFDAMPLAFVELGRDGIVSDEFTHILDLFKVIVIAIGIAALLATLAFVLASFLGSRRRIPEESEDGLSA